MSGRGGPVPRAEVMALVRAGRVWGTHNGYRVLWWVTLDNGRRRQVTTAIRKALASAELDLVDPVAPSCMYLVKVPTPGEERADVSARV